jgi:adenosylmethionine-8-amino-7-oxononanoate aminotransferase
MTCQSCAAPHLPPDHGITSHPLVGYAASAAWSAIELMADPTQKVPFDPAFKIGARVVEHALDYGVILRPLGDVVSFCPPLIIRGAEIDLLFDAVTRALDRVAAEIGGDGRRQVA